MRTGARWDTRLLRATASLIRIFGKTTSGRQLDELPHVQKNAVLETAEGLRRTILSILARPRRNFSMA